MLDKILVGHTIDNIETANRQTLLCYNTKHHSMCTTHCQGINYRWPVSDRFMCSTYALSSVYIRTSLEQQLNNVHMPVLAGRM